MVTINGRSRDKLDRFHHFICTAMCQWETKFPSLAKSLSVQDPTIYERRTKSEV